MDDNQDNKFSELNTGGGASVGKDVTTGRDFAGRDIIINNYHQPPTTQVAEKTESGKKLTAKPRSPLSWLKISETIIAALIGAAATIGAAYWFSNNRLNPPITPTQVAIVQQATPTATQVPPTATIVPPTKTPELLPTASPLPAADAKLISATLTIPASPMPTETPVPVATSTLVPPTSTPTSTFTSSPTATSTGTLLPTPTPSYPCEAEIIFPSGNKLSYFIHEGPSSNSDSKSLSFPSGTHVSIVEKSKNQEVWYHIWSTEGRKRELGWISPENLQLSPACPKQSSR